MKNRPAKDRYQIFPPLTPAQYDSLKSSIASRGVDVPVVRDQDGNLIDGWHREKACGELKVFCPTEVRFFSTEAEKYELILTLNCQRRQLNRREKRDLIAVYLVRDPEIADNYLADTIGGISKNTVAKVRQHLEETRTIKKQAKLRGKDAKRRPTRYKKIVANTPTEVKKALGAIKDLPDNCAGKTVDVTTAARRARRNKKAEERNGRLPVQLPADPIRLYHCAFQELEAKAGIRPASSSLFLADIPWQEEFLPQLPALAQLGMRVLRDGGLFVVYSGSAYLNTVLRILEDNGLTWRWPAFAHWTCRANIVHSVNVVSNCLPILVFSKGEWKERQRWHDVLSGFSVEKRWHEWERPLEEIMTVLRFFTEPGDLVIDPTGGGFTTAVGCLRLGGLSCISCDIVEECYHQGLRRIDEERRLVGHPQESNVG